MESVAKKQKTEVVDEDILFGYIHNVNDCRVSPYKRVKLFNAIIQVSREEFRNFDFSPEKHATFLQAEKNRSPIKLERFKRRVSKLAVFYNSSLYVLYSIK